MLKPFQSLVPIGPLKMSYVTSIDNINVINQINLGFKSWIGQDVYSIVVRSFLQNYVWFGIGSIVLATRLLILEAK